MTEHDQAVTWNIETLLVHGGCGSADRSENGTPTISPIYTSTTYLHGSVEELDQAFSGVTQDGKPAYVYARHGNPTTCTFEQALALAEGGVGAVAYSSGMAAIHAAFLTAGLAPGASILVSRDVYGASIALLQKVFAPMGVTVKLVDMCQPGAADLIREEEPDVIFVETLSNPLVKLIDLEAIGAAARAVGAVSIVDSTFTTPYLLNPLRYQFDLVVHSATKYISGHGDTTGGIVISARNALLDQLRTYSILLGATHSPFDSHLMTRGLRTLALRMERHCSNALQVAHFLQQHPAVSHVYYSGLPDHPQHQLASKLLRPEHYGGLLAFDLKTQTRAAAFQFMNSVQLCLPGTTLGDVFSLVTYPLVSTHRTLTKAELANMGITEGCIRLSVGIEHVDDIIRDLDQALSPLK